MNVTFSKLAELAELLRLDVLCAGACLANDIDYTTSNCGLTTYKTFNHLITRSHNRANRPLLRVTSYYSNPFIADPVKALHFAILV